MSAIEASNPARKGFSLGRVVMALLPFAFLLFGFYLYQRETFEAEAQRQGEQLLLGTLGLSRPTKNKLDERFADTDGDLVADSPKDAADLLDPDPLIFSYVGGDDAERQKEVWKEFLLALSAATGKRVEYLAPGSIDDQLRALKEGKLHVAGINTGNVPSAVNACGFVPRFTFGNEQGRFGYTLKIIVPANGAIKEVQDLRGKQLALTGRGSNSGYKAPLVVLMNDFDLLPQRDFSWVITYGHDASIHGIAQGKYEAAATASDMLDRASARGEIEPKQYRAIYESERFPPAALGYLYNLQPELAEKVKQTLATFDWKGTGLEKEFSASGASAFVPVIYKDDWALIRRIDDAMGTKYSVE
jgi:phosphonate transport system substrate-binding protein